MATNPWANFNAAEASRRVARRPRNPQVTAANANPRGFYSWFQAPSGPQNNAVTRALERVGGNDVTRAMQNMAMPAAPGGPGGGGRGGGGGGGGPAVTQAMIDALSQALGVQGPQLNYTPLPAFQGTRLGAFNAAPYQQQQAMLNQAVTADRNNIANNQVATTQAVQGAYSNPYQTAQVQQGATTPVVGSTLMGTAGAVADPAAAQQANRENAQNQGSFQDLYGILGANQAASQQSRVQQVAMDANYGRQALNAQALGMRGGIAQQQAQAAAQWQQQQAERDYQNSLMRQQYAVQNAQGLQAVQQANWQQQNTNLQARLQPILDLISQSANVPGLNFAPLMAALRGGR